MPRFYPESDGDSLWLDGEKIKIFRDHYVVDSQREFDTVACQSKAEAHALASKLNAEYMKGGAMLNPIVVEHYLKLKISIFENK